LNFFLIDFAASAMPLFAKRNGLEALLHRPRPSLWEQFIERPCIFLARQLYTWRQPAPAQPLVQPVTIVCVSDTHNSQPKLPDGDVLIHAGDLTQSGSFGELQATVKWLREQPHPVKIVVAGNHDLLLDSSRDELKGGHDPVEERKALDWGDIIYLENAAKTITCPNCRQLHVYGSPRSVRHGNWAFQYPRGEDFWTGTIPPETDILITHGPPKTHLDLLGLRVGCEHLLREIWRVRPRLHVFGHAHEGAGTEWLRFDGLQEAYERTLMAGGGLWNLIQTLREFVRAYFSPVAEAKCLLVNAAVVGGLRDDERRRPVKVVI
jgi:predicted phosphodiesterase